MRRESKSLRRAVLEYCRSRHNSDEGDSIIITSLLLLPVMFFIIISAIDMGLYFNSQAVIERSAQDAARTSILYGGAGSLGYHTVLEDQYSNAAVSRSHLSQLSSDVGFAVNNSVEYALVNDLLGAKTALAELENVRCAPAGLNRVGDVSYCDVEWSYDGLPVSVWGMMVSNTESQLSTGNAQSQTTHAEVTTKARS